MGAPKPKINHMKIPIEEIIARNSEYPLRIRVLRLLADVGRPLDVDTIARILGVDDREIIRARLGDLVARGWVARSKGRARYRGWRPLAALDLSAEQLRTYRAVYGDKAIPVPLRDRMYASDERALSEITYRIPLPALEWLWNRGAFDRPYDWRDLPGHVPGPWVALVAPSLPPAVTAVEFGIVTAAVGAWERSQSARVYDPMGLTVKLLRSLYTDECGARADSVTAIGDDERFKARVSAILATEPASTALLRWHRGGADEELTADGSADGTAPAGGSDERE